MKILKFLALYNVIPYNKIAPSAKLNRLTDTFHSYNKTHVTYVTVNCSKLRLIRKNRNRRDGWQYITKL